jgi:hypothetical protein
MHRYRFDFLRSDGGVFATHEIDYATDRAAIAGGHLINSPTPIGRSFTVWREDELNHHHENDLARA